ncbi:MAG: oligosaccharide flippase family protein [Armatimonadetes bacterium]|nr:oligosaccharide flippase family protein [Armatimonadota bacterium]
MGDVRKLYSNSAVYAMGGILSKAIGFLMIPVYTHVLTPSDYGTIELMYRAMDILSLAASMGVGHAVVRVYFDYQDKRDRGRVVSSGLISVFAAAFLVAAVVGIFKTQSSIIILGHARHGELVQLAALSMLLDLATIVPLAYIQAEQRSMLYTSIGLFKLILGLSTNIWLVVYLRMGVMGVAWSAVASNGLAAMVLLPLVVRRTGLGFSWTKTRQLWSYGLPLIPGQFSMFVLSFGDRFILGRYGGTSEVGLYSLGFTFGVIITILITQSFQTAWVPYAVSIAGDPDCKRAYSEVMKQFTILIVGFALMMSLAARDLIHLMAAPAYWSAYMVVPLICLSQVMRGLAYILEVGMVISKRTAYRIPAVVSATVVNLGLDFLLVPGMGAMGAAWAAAVSFTLFAVLTYMLSRRLYPINYQWAPMVATFVLGAGLFAAGELIHPGSRVMAVAVKAGLFVAFPACVLVTGICPTERVAKIKSVLLSASGHIWSAGA